MRYIVVSSEYLPEFEKAVADKTRQGWKPQGGVAVTLDQETGAVRYYQAMTTWLITPEPPQ